MSDVERLALKVSVSAGNTSGTLALVRTGTLYLAGADNITISQNGNTISFSGGGGGANVSVSNAIQSVSSQTGSGTNTSRFAADDHVHAGVGPAGVTNIGNTSGNTSVMHGRFVLAGGNNVTLSVSTSNNNAQTITISAGNVSGQFTAGMSTGGNTSGTSGVVSNQVVFAGGNNITLSQSTNGNSATITISGAGQLAVGISTGGNTSGTSGTATAQYIFAGGNNITLSQSSSGNSATLTISAGAQIAVGISTGGNTSGTSGTATAQYIFAGGNNITLSQSSSGNSATLTISAGDALAGGVGISTGGNTSGTSGTATARYVFAGGNNITLSQSSSGNSATLTISAGNAFSGGISTGGNTAGTSGVVADRLVLAGGNNCTVSQSTNAQSATVTISVANPFSAGISTMGNTSGTSGMVQDRVVFVGTPNITLSQSTNAQSATITISGANPGAQAMSFWQNAVPASTDNAVNSAYAVGSLYVFPLDLGNNIFPGDMTVSTLALGHTINYTGGANSTKAFSSTVNFGLYTINSSSLSLINSISTSWGTGADNASLSSLYQGKRFLTMNSSLASAQWSMRQSLYYGGIILRTSGANVALSNFGAVFLESGIRSGTMGVGNTTGDTTMGGMPLHGIYSTTTTAFPGSIAQSELQKTALLAYFVPHVIFNNIMASY